MSDLNDELSDIFRDEAAERLNQMETVLLAIESGDAPDAGTGSVDSLFRNAHTIKGAAGMLGLDDIRALAHAVEEVLAAVRDAGVFRPELAAPLLRATAALRAQVAGDAGAGEAGAGLLDDLAASKAMLAHGEAGVAAPSAAPGPGLPGPGLPGPRMPGAATFPSASARKASSTAAMQASDVSSRSTSARVSSSAALIASS